MDYNFTDCEPPLSLLRPVLHRDLHDIGGGDALFCPPGSVDAIVDFADEPNDNPFSGPKSRCSWKGGYICCRLAVLTIGKVPYSWNTPRHSVANSQRE